jgi:hypothetical protein
MSLPAQHAPFIEESVRYLASEAALASLRRDFYWPKWDSPWWHMLLLYELGEVQKIPAVAVSAMVEGLSRSLQIFPIYPGDLPPGVDPMTTNCHCALGTMYQVLAAWSVDVDSELPWIRPWFLRYQMADGGLSCDNEAYLVKDECPSSIVGTVSPFEAILLYTPRDFTLEETAFLDRAAAFFIERQLMHGSATEHNREERTAEKSWLKLCFPRFYLYDVLRGLRALLLWADKTGRALPARAVEPVVTYLEGRFPGGDVTIERRAYEGRQTRLLSFSGEWVRGQPATLFPLLEVVSTPSTVSPYLTRHFQECRALLPRITLT